MINNDSEKDNFISKKNEKYSTFNEKSKGSSQLRYTSTDHHHDPNITIVEPSMIRAKRESQFSHESEPKELSVQRRVWILVVASMVSNIVLFSAKVAVFFTSHSLAVLASAVDSFLDLISQVIVYFALKGSTGKDERIWPVGTSRLEPVGIVVCASLMGMASFQVIYTSIERVVVGVLDPADIEIPNVDGITVGLLIVATFTKSVLFFLCYALRHQSHSVLVLYEDHRNDVLSNSVALVTAYSSHRWISKWWLDPAGAILISLYICYVWVGVAKEQTEYLVGRAANPDFLDEVRELADKHHELINVDIVRAYHFGKRYLVELEIVLPGSMIVVDAHDIALSLQREVEELDDVERAFVHVDYTTRDVDEHKCLSTHKSSNSLFKMNSRDEFPLEADADIVLNGVENGRGGSSSGEGEAF